MEDLHGKDGEKDNDKVEVTSNEIEEEGFHIILLYVGHCNFISNFY